MLIIHVKSKDSLLEMASGSLLFMYFDCQIYVGRVETQALPLRQI